MAAERTLTAGSAVSILLVLLVTGPAVGLVDVTPSQRTQLVGDGTASVSSVEVDTDRLALDRGRFGTGVDYLRIPAVTVRLDSVSDRPRLVYRVAVPEIGVEKIRTRVLRRETDSVRLSMSHRAIPRERLRADEGPYTVVVEVRVQSFEVDETVYSEAFALDVPSGGR